MIENVKSPGPRGRSRWRTYLRLIRLTRMRRPGLTILAGLGVAVLLSGLLVWMPGRYLEFLPGIDPPRIIVEATAASVAFRVPEIINLVSNARPDFGVIPAPGMREGHELAGFDGLRLDSLLDRPAAWRPR